MYILSKKASLLIFLIFALAFPQQGSAQCGITNIQTGLQSTCNPATNTYSQEVIVSFNNPPADSLITINEQTFPLNPSQQGFFQGWITGLPSNGKKVPAHAFFTSEPACSLIISSAFTAPPPCKSYILQPTLQDFIAEDANQNDIIDGGDFLSYLARISNNSSSTVDGVTFDTLPPVGPNLIIDLSSVQIAPIALPDTIGFHQIDGYDLLQNDIDPDGAAADLIIVAVDNFSANGGTITLSTNCEGIQYTPPSGTFVPDQFEYVIMDPDGMISSATVVLQADLDIDPTKVIYVDNDPPATVTGAPGSKTNPYTTLAAAQSHAGAEVIYVSEGNAAYDMGIALSDGQYLIGAGAGLNCGGCAIAEPAGTAPVFTNTSTTTNDGHAVVLAKNNTVQGIKIENTKGYAFANASSSSPDSVGELYIDIESVTGEGGVLLLTACDNQAQIKIQQASSSDTSALIFDNVTGNLSYSGSITTTNSGRLMVVNACPGSFTFRQNTCSDVISQAVSDGEGILIKNLEGDLAFKEPVQIGTTATPNGGDHGITIFENNPGNISFNSVDIHTENHTGIWAEDNMKEGLIIIEDGTIIAESGPAIMIGQLDVAINLTLVESTNSPTDGVAIKEGHGFFHCEELKGENIGSICNPLTVNLDNSGNGSLTPSDLYTGVYGNAANYTFSASQTTFGTTNIGTNTVTLTVTDATSETFTCSAIVTVAPFLPPLSNHITGGAGGASFSGPSSSQNPQGYTGTGGCTFDMSSIGAPLPPGSNGPEPEDHTGEYDPYTDDYDYTDIWIGSFTSSGAVGAGINVNFPDDENEDELTNIEVEEINITCGNQCRGAGVIGNNVDDVSLGDGTIETYKNDGVIITNNNPGSRLEIDLDNIKSEKAVGLICIGKPETTTKIPIDPNPATNTARIEYLDTVIVKGGTINVTGTVGVEDTAVYLKNYFLDVVINTVFAEMNPGDPNDIGIWLENTTGHFTVKDSGRITGSNTVFFFGGAEHVSINNMEFSDNGGSMTSFDVKHLWMNNCTFLNNSKTNYIGGTKGTVSIYKSAFRDNGRNLYLALGGDISVNSAFSTDAVYSYIGHSTFEYTPNKPTTNNSNTYNVYATGASESGQILLSNNTLSGSRHFQGACVIKPRSVNYLATVSHGSFEDNYRDIQVSGSGNAGKLNILNIDYMGPTQNGTTVGRSECYINYLPNSIQIKTVVSGQTIISGISEINVGGYTTCTPNSGLDLSYFHRKFVNHESKIAVHGNTLTGGNGSTKAISIVEECFNNPATNYLSMKNNVGFYSEIINRDTVVLCADITGNDLDPTGPGGTRLRLENSATVTGFGNTFSLERNPGNITATNPALILEAQNSGVAADYDITGTITPVNDNTCSAGSGFNDIQILITDGYLQEVLLPEGATTAVAEIPLEVTVIKGDGEPQSNVQVTCTSLNSTQATFTTPPLTNAKGITQTTVTVGDQTGWLEFDFEYKGSKASAWIYVNQI